MRDRQSVLPYIDADNAAVQNSQSHNTNASRRFRRRGPPRSSRRPEIAQHPVYPSQYTRSDRSRPASSQSSSSDTGSVRQAQRTWTGPAQRVEYDPGNGMLFFVPAPTTGLQQAQNLLNAHGGRITTNDRGEYVYQWCARRGDASMRAATEEESARLYSARNAWLESYRGTPTTNVKRTIWVGKNPDGSYVPLNREQQQSCAIRHGTAA